MVELITTENIAILISLLAPGSSCIAMWRTRRNDQETRELSFLATRDEALNLILDAQTELVSLNLKVETEFEEAKRVNNSDVITVLSQLQRDIKRHLDQIASAITNLRRAKPEGMTHQQLLKFRTEEVVQTGDLAETAVKVAQVDNAILRLEARGAIIAGRKLTTFRRINLAPQSN